ncbi:hypothetical protein [Streptomyces hygroscopicus]|uniref:hypothetical protein n=1 Tax=Streptomyces hygroscopicus TaxID=1912 RepID=UPI00223F7396|nr:hypothetical protein [Streptomyces hygroscopicus]
MDEIDTGKLQIYSVEERGDATATCIVRCVGGIVRTGQQFGVGSTLNPTRDPSVITLVWIKRYEQLMEFIDPPHNAKVHFVGAGASALERGVTITAITTRHFPEGQ